MIGNSRSIFDERARPIILKQSERTELKIVDREILEVVGDSLPARGISCRTETRCIFIIYISNDWQEHAARLASPGMGPLPSVARVSWPMRLLGRC